MQNFCFKILKLKEKLLSLPACNASINQNIFIR